MNLDAYQLYFQECCQYDEICRTRGERPDRCKGCLQDPNGPDMDRPYFCPDRRGFCPRSGGAFERKRDALERKNADVDPLHPGHSHP